MLYNSCCSHIKLSLQCSTVLQFTFLISLGAFECTSKYLVSYLVRESSAAVYHFAIPYLVGQFQLHFLRRIPHFWFKAEPQFLTGIPGIFLRSGP